jgi:hypothetical protein
MDRGHPDGDDPADEPYRSFRQSVEQARADAETRNIAIVATAAATNWQAAAWLLERTYPDRWARISQRNLAGAVNEPPARPDDPFAEVDELAAARRRYRPA